MTSFLGPSSPPRRFVHSVLSIAPDGLALPILSGSLRGKRWFLNSGNYSHWLGSYEMTKQAAFAAELKPGDVVFDIGAHVGFYSLLAAILTRPNGVVVAFEPLKRNVKWLRRHARTNRLNVTIFEAAVADASGPARFRSGRDSYTGSLNEDGDDVHVVSIDALCESGILAMPNVMKIDVEGAELLVLRGAERTIRAAMPVIFLAVHGSKAHRDCFEVLGGLGYHFDELTGESVAPGTEFIFRSDLRGGVSDWR